MGLPNGIQNANWHESVSVGVWKSLLLTGGDRAQGILGHQELQSKFGGAGVERKLQLAELECLRLEPYENSRLYKEKMKAVHDKNIRGKEFKAGDLVLLYNSRLRLLPGKLRSKWEGPYQVEKAEPYGVYHLRHPSSPNIFKVNGHRLKLYHGERMKSNKEIEVFLLEDAPLGKEQ
ncbi:uncharacterized protein [Arachis hypogaea]|uniref:uncharacterized protein n=1 Tax=Arachis hypogaea TaxID=3818 RepID=UPI000DED10A3|nr:uncharacterized protein LOC112721522 [Arachis hypogaea]